MMFKILIEPVDGKAGFFRWAVHIDGDLVSGDITNGLGTTMLLTNRAVLEWHEQRYGPTYKD